MGVGDAERGYARVEDVVMRKTLERGLVFER
jgi:hypothetical protein